MTESQPMAMHNKIKVVSQFSGVPTPTLRIWESRYGALNPHRTPSGQRLYSDDEILKATLLKRLTDSGHAISRIAQLNTQQLKDLVLASQTSHVGHTSTEEEQRSLSLLVVGLGLASRLESRMFHLQDASTRLNVSEVYADLAQALNAQVQQKPQVLMVQVNSLHVDTKADIDRLIDQTQVTRTIVLYNFGQQQVVEWMKTAGMTVRRGPVSDAELQDLVASVLLLDARKSAGLQPHGAVIPARRYSDEGLQAITQISTNVLCECPRHVAEIISMLCHFEQYSHDCLNKSSEDAHLHAHLKAVAGSCRAMFERAMEEVAQHENIDLKPFRLDD